MIEPVKESIYNLQTKANILLFAFPVENIYRKMGERAGIKHPRLSDQDALVNIIIVSNETNPSIVAPKKFQLKQKT